MSSPSFYNPEDRKKGFIVGYDRQGKLQEIPLLSVSIGVVTSATRQIIHVAQISEIGLDVKKNLKRVSAAVSRLKASGIDVSLFINPSIGQIDASVKAGAGIIELHTGEYANARSDAAVRKERGILKKAVKHALSLGLEVNAGHGLNYENVRDIACINGMNELNIGHSIISRAVFVGISAAVEEMLELVQ